MYIYKHLNIYQNMFFLVAQKSSSLPYNLHLDHPPSSIIFIVYYVLHL